MRLSRLTTRQWLIVAHDLVVTAAALVLTLLLRFEDVQLATRLEWLPTLLAGWLVFAAAVYFGFGLHEPKWRFTSLREFLAQEGIETRPLFNPVHTMPMYSARFQSHPNAELLGRSGINLPSWPGLDDSAVDFICVAIRDWYRRRETKSPTSAHATT